jgi:antitoxin CptB|tara:strand:+ start:258 stop:515 length:258 start_codon:yes stop_codon:yes gene_type:complete
MNKLENLKKKIIYRSNYRGTKEMDLLLSSFTRYHINKLTELELIDLDKFLSLEDEEIYNFYQNNIISKNIKNNKMLNLIKNFKIK